MQDYGILLFVFSVLINLVIIVISKKYNFFLDPLANIKVQSFHKNITPRAGGISIYFLSLLASYFTSDMMFSIILAFLPAFIYGVYEDIDGNTPQKMRLMVMAASTLLATFLTGITVKSIGFIDIPQMVQVPFTVFAVIGLASAINFIDGLNGLASGVTMVTLTTIGIAAYSTGNHQLASTMILASSIMLGFLCLNFPFGKIFLGDAGAYFLGYILAMSSEALVLNNNAISPWFPVALLGYPIIETLFTMWRRYRRLKIRGINFFTAEKVHLHSLLYLRVFKNNPVASIAIVMMFSLNAVISFQFKDSGPACAFIFFIEAIIYMFLYKNIVNFKLGKLAINTANLVKDVKYRKALLQVSRNQTIIDTAELFKKSEEKVLIGVQKEADY